MSAQKEQMQDKICPRSNAYYFKNMELIIYLLSGKTTNECRKYWILPTPL
jgi:hypothetical protein